MVTTDEIAEVPLFAALSAADRERLSRTAADISLAAGEYAVHEGDERALFVVLDSPNGAAMHLGRLLQLLFLGPGSPNTAGPGLEPWQGTVLLQLAMIVLALFAAVRLVGGYRAPRPRARVTEDAEREGVQPLDE